ncbi:hypothetical protein DFAR_2650002 [Desulfarculales bacterium]
MDNTDPQYRSIQTSLPNLQTLQAQNQRQEAPINAFARGLTVLKDQTTELRAFNQRLRAMANIDKKGVITPLAGVDDPEEAITGAGVRLSSTRQERQISTLQRDMAQLSVETEAEQALQEELAKFLNESGTPYWPPRLPYGQCAAGRPAASVTAPPPGPASATFT